MGAAACRLCGRHVRGDRPLIGVAEWEGVAIDAGDETGCNDPPVSAFELAACYDFELVPWWQPGAQLDEDRGRIRFNPRRPLEQQHRDVAHELGHYLQRRAGLPDLEDGARYIGGATLMPKRVMDRDIKRLAWSVVKLRERHVHVSELALAVRITQLRDAVVSCIDPRGRKRAWRRASPGVVDPRATSRTPSKFERELARAAWEAGAEVRANSLCYAVPVIDVDGAGEERVVVVCELEQLSLRL